MPNIFFLTKDIRMHTTTEKENNNAEGSWNRKSKQMERNCSEKRLNRGMRAEDEDKTREIWDMPIQFYESFHLFNSSNISLYLHFCLLMKVLGRPSCATDGIKRDLVSFWHCDISCIYDTVTAYLHIYTSLVQFYHNKLIKVRMKSLLHTGCFPISKLCHKGKNYCGTRWHALCSRNVFFAEYSSPSL